MPASALFSIESIPPGFRDVHNSKDLTVHGLLASFLTFGGEDLHPYVPWQATWPSLKDFQGSMPILWPSKFRGSLSCKKGDGTIKATFCPLPPAIGVQRSTSAMKLFESSLLVNQEKKLKKDWNVVSEIFPRSSFELYTYYWLIINTRSFYFELPGSKIQPAREDRMVLCPFIDYFNHADHGCEVSFDATGFTVTSDRIYGSAASRRRDKD